ncbi:MAG TPA: heavy metal-binding domain-containing protein [Stellaceae bacterium]|nr:heavy metal-binding domain-containing protein [Stellaceae bacterium]
MPPSDNYPHDHRHVHAGEQSAETARDPVCGMSVDPASALHRTQFEKRSYVFCSAGCRQKFAADPHPYLREREQAPAAAVLPGETLWTCPMHPEIVRKEPGSCPICGMALEPMTPTGGEVSP